MKLQTKLTLAFSILLLFMAGCLFGALHMMSQSASRMTAESTLTSAVKSFVTEAEVDAAFF